MSNSDYYRGRRDAEAVLRDYKPTKVCPTAKKNKETLSLLVNEASKKAINNSYWNGYYYILKKGYGEVLAYYNFGDCDNYFERRKTEKLNTIISKEGADYEKIVTAQTQKQNKIVLFIGASIMLVGFVIIIKK